MGVPGQAAVDRLGDKFGITEADRYRPLLKLDSFRYRFGNGTD